MIESIFEGADSRGEHRDGLAEGVEFGELRAGDGLDSGLRDGVAEEMRPARLA